MGTVLGGHAPLLLMIALLLVLGVESVLIVHGALPGPGGDAVKPDSYLWSLYRADSDPYIWMTYAMPSEQKEHRR